MDHGGQTETGLIAAGSINIKIVRMGCRQVCPLQVTEVWQKRLARGDDRHGTEDDICNKSQGIYWRPY